MRTCSNGTSNRSADLGEHRLVPWPVFEPTTAVSASASTVTEPLSPGPCLLDERHQPYPRQARPPAASRSWSNACTAIERRLEQAR
jgi:hypothetical protein